ncbi:MAG: acetyl/propionyl/methylcrotonyl-CoA carboxylase subunit alpha [Sandaracinaceae bacterium]
MAEPEVTLRPLRRLLIANRGEIALRIQRTARAMGIRTIAVFSDADADHPFVHQADEAVRLGPAPAAASYLSVDRVLEAAQRTGADAVHPGYGFLAENAAFAEAIEAAGLLFVGPSADAIRRMGDKRAAKALAEEAGVPVLPGYRGEDQSDAALRAAADDLGYPLLVKASAGGGGRGMRLVRSASELPGALDGARRESLKAFGDDTLLLERYVERPRHVEIQILGDRHGALIHLGERECSIQRRHQKVIEEAPSPGLDPSLRARMGEAALRLGQALGYHSAGTVEMIVAPDGTFAFLEVNTRLQVEHPVTEEVTNLDLVEMQLRVARGERLAIDQELVDTLRGGAAIECRLYAEDPHAGYLPQTGRVLAFDLPDAEGVRIDAGVEEGTEVSVHYDPMLAKVIAWGFDRPAALARMRWALESMTVAGPTTNRDHLLAILAEPAFASGALHTGFLEEHLAGGGAEPSPGAEEDAAVAATLAAQADRARDAILPSLRSGFRSHRAADQEVGYRHGERKIRVRYADLGRHRFRVTVDDAEAREVARVAFDGRRVTLEVDGHRRTFRWVRDGSRHYVVTDAHTLRLDEQPRFPAREGASAADGCAAPMPGQVLRVLVAEGDAVTAGQTLLVLEAMKMEHAIEAPHDGVVQGLTVAEGQSVGEGELLATVVDPG